MSESQDKTSGRNSQGELLRIALRSWQTDIHTALKGEIVSYNPETKRADVQISQMRKHTSPIIDNNNGNLEIPVLPDMPVQQPSAGNLYLGFEPKVGDECMVIFSEREIKTAKQRSGTYELAYSWMHDLSDGVVVPFCISEGRARDLTENGVSLLDSFIELAEITNAIAQTLTMPPVPAEIAQLTLLIQRIKDAA